MAEGDTSAGAAAASASAEDEDPTIRVLRRGDLVKVLERSGPNVKERPEGLARILKSVRIPEDEMSELTADADSQTDARDKAAHPYRYDIEWVLGGRASNVERHELVYTTAEAEGMLDGGPRRKRKAATEPAKTTATTVTKQATKKRTKAAPGGAKGRKKASTASSTKKTASASSSRAKGAGKRKLQSQADDPLLSSNDATKQSGKDMYEKHRREFERMLARIEKVDQFGFFLDDVPPEHDDGGDNSDNAATPAAPMAIDEAVADHCGVASSSLEEKKDEEDSIPTSTPNACPKVANDVASSVLRAPYNWAVIKKRAEKGRYVADRQKQVDGKLQQLQQSYRAWLEKEALDPTSAQRLASIERPTSLVMEEKTRDGATTKDDGDAAAATDRGNSSSEGSGYRRFQVPNPKGVDWDLFRRDVLDMCDAAVARDPDEGEDDGPGTLGYAIKKIKETLDQMYTKTGQRQMAELESADMRQKYVDALKNTENHEAAMQCDWRKEAFPERRYERLERKNVICAGLSSVDERSAVYELKTSLPDSFVGLSYTYDDMGQSEGWMKTVVDEADKSNRKRTKKKKKDADDASSAAEETGTTSKEATDVTLDAETQREVSKALSADDGVVRAQVRTTMDILLIGVQDKVMTDARVLQHPEVRSANWDDGDQSRRNSDPGASVSSADGLGTATMGSDLGTSDITQMEKREPEVAEQPVWGMDCYTRKNIAICLETDLDSAVASEFIERWLLPAINSCPVDVAHDISCAARVLEGLPPIATPPPLPANNKGKGGSGSKPGVVAESTGGTSEDGSHVFLSKALKAKIEAYGPPWLKDAAHRLRLAVETLGTDLFRVHPKGHGSVVLKKSGLKSNTLVTHYRGEIYPPWRWGEKLDAIEKMQKRIGLRPTLPDFYNMALERPRVDPRGFGLLFVDASRKAGLGSSFSHSCDPTCEVKVVAVNGELSLAMTTLRDLECGEELTFDYHAVTESVNEYHAAICLCGHKNCRGSFLHFATADCYQQVLSRNAPIAVQFANLAKGCIKEILSKEDRRVLQSHGFGTAAFGACSFNHHRRGENEELDSLDNVPIWLKTFTADTLRYIEYERRALPIALLSNHFSQGGVPFTNTNDDATEDQAATKESSKGKGKKSSSSSRSKKGGKKAKPSSSNSSKKADAKRSAPFDESLIPPEDRKAVPGCRPVSTFFFFSKQEKDTFIRSVEEQGQGHLTGLDLNQAMQKIAGAAWRSLSEEKKQVWKDRAYAEWEENGGKEKAKLEEERQGRVKAIKDAAKVERDKADEEKRKQAEAVAKSKKKKKKVEINIETNKISFEAADAEGWAAMEQRIHQLTQTLSRVGRVIDRHREAVFESSPTNADGRSSSDLGPNVHSPLTMMSDEHVVGLLWSHPSGIVQTLIRQVGQAPWSNTPIFKSIVEVIVKHKLLCGCAFPSKDGRLSYSPIAAKIAPEEKLPPTKARRLVVAALLEMREAIIAGIQQMETEAMQHDKEVAKAKREVARRKREEKKKAEEVEKGLRASAEDAASGSSGTQHDTSALVEAGASHVPTSDLGQMSAAASDGGAAASIPSKVDTSTTASGSASETAAAAAAALSALESKGLPWQEQLEQKYKLESAADLLLMYAHTSTFFSLKPYKTFESTPIEVCARELGNAVPRSLVEGAGPVAAKSTAEVGTEVSAATSAIKGASEGSSKMEDTAAATAKASESGNSSSRVNSEGEICEPDQVVTSVNVVYSGHYVLSCLLQWYLGGISLKSGLPDMNGCIVLPTMASCWSEKANDVSHQQTKASGRSRSSKAAASLNITTYDSEVRPKLVEWFEDRHKRGSPWSDDLLRYFPPPSESDDALLMMGSPVLDLLITGNDENIEEVADGLQYGNSDAADSDKRKKRRGKKSAAERLQSSMDEGMPAQAVANWVQCENPECMKWRKLPWHVDVDLLPEKFYCKDNKWNPGYDNCDAPEDDWDMADAPVKFNEIPLEEFKPGAKFDVIRKDRDYYTEGTVLEVDFESSVKRVYFRFRGMPDKWNEWVEAESTRIAPHQAYTRAPITKKPAATAKATKKPEKKKGGDNKKRSATSSSVATSSSADAESSSAPPSKRPKANVDVGALRDSIVGSGPSQASSKNKPPRVVEIQTNVNMAQFAHHLQGGVSHPQHQRPAPSGTQAQQAHLLQQMRAGQRPQDDQSLQQLLLIQEQERQRRLQYNRAIQQRQLHLQQKQQQYQRVAPHSGQPIHHQSDQYGQAGVQQHHEAQSLNNSLQGFQSQDYRLQALAGTLQDERLGLEYRLRELQEQRYAAAAAAVRAIDRGVPASSAYSNAPAYSNAAAAQQVGGPTHQQPLPSSNLAGTRPSVQQPSDGRPGSGGAGQQQGQNQHTMGNPHR